MQSSVCWKKKLFGPPFILNTIIDLGFNCPWAPNGNSYHYLVRNEVPHHVLMCTRPALNTSTRGCWRSAFALVAEASYYARCVNSAHASNLPQANCFLEETECVRDKCVGDVHDPFNRMSEYTLLIVPYVNLETTYWVVAHYSGSVHNRVTEQQ